MFVSQRRSFFCLNRPHLKHRLCIEELFNSSHECAYHRWGHLIHTCQVSMFVIWVNFHVTASLKKRRSRMRIPAFPGPKIWVKGLNWHKLAIQKKESPPRFSQSAEGSILFHNTFMVKFAVSRCWQRWQTCTATAETGHGPQWDKGLGYMWNDHEALRGIRRLVLVKHGFRVLCYMFVMIFVSVF